MGYELGPWAGPEAERQLMGVTVAIVDVEQSDEHGLRAALEVGLFDDLGFRMEIDTARGWACMRDMEPEHAHVLAQVFRPPPPRPAPPQPDAPPHPWLVDEIPLAVDLERLPVPDHSELHWLGDSLLVFHEQGALALLEPAAELRPIGRLPARPKTVVSAAQRVAMVLQDRSWTTELLCWDLDSEPEPRAIPLDPELQLLDHSLALSPDGALLAVQVLDAERMNHLRVLDTTTGACVFHAPAWQASRWTSTGLELACYHRDGTQDYGSWQPGDARVTPAPAPAFHDAPPRRLRKLLDHFATIDDGPRYIVDLQSGRGWVLAPGWLEGLGAIDVRRDGRALTLCLFGGRCYRADIDQRFVTGAEPKLDRETAERQLDMALADDEYFLMGVRTRLSLFEWSQRTGLSEAEVRERLDASVKRRFEQLEAAIDAGLEALASGDQGATGTLYEIPVPYAVAHTIAVLGTDSTAEEAARDRLRKRLRSAALRALLDQLGEPAGVEAWLALTVPAPPAIIERLRAVAERCASDPLNTGFVTTIARITETLGEHSISETTMKQLEGRLERVERMAEIGAPPIILTNDLRMLADLLEAAL